MGLFGNGKKRTHVLGLLTTMKDITERATAKIGTGDNDPKKLFDRLHEACYLFGKVNKQKVEDAMTLKMVYTAADSVLAAYHRDDEPIQREEMEDILCVQDKAAPDCDLNKLLNRYKDKIAPALA